MVLRLDVRQLAALREARDGIVLGTILRDGTVLLASGDSRTRRGHSEWIEREGLSDAVRGFSLVVDDGRVTGFYHASALNPAIHC